MYGLEADHVAELEAKFPIWPVLWQVPEQQDSDNESEAGQAGTSDGGFKDQPSIVMSR